MMAGEVPHSSGQNRPQRVLPAKACDSHMHIFDRRFLPSPHWIRQPPEAPVSAYRPLQARLGTQRAVVVTPSTYVSSPDEIASALRTADYFGLKVKMGPNVRKRTGYVGGTIAERAADVNAMFADPEVKAIFAIRGGYGSAQILPALDYDLIAKNPKIFPGVAFANPSLLFGLFLIHGTIGCGLPMFAQPLAEFSIVGVALVAPVGTGVVTHVKDPTHPVRSVRSGSVGRQSEGDLSSPLGLYQ